MPVEATPAVPAEPATGGSRPLMIKTPKSGNTVQFRLPAAP